MDASKKNLSYINTIEILIMTKIGKNIERIEKQIGAMRATQKAYEHELYLCKEVYKYLQNILCFLLAMFGFADS